ncbi:DUF4351 domain-containing protein [Candidatus Viridilinea mediisalina]|uniref:DUF4351 domain-containing protein n=1 Tax=Candidatus Viridilinea mediisalina TaxID=2024553 RepID=UPI000F59521F|nr:DUF4351 domain-containing protein [Candidatus Viridilinea mediisalina]
MRHLYRLLDQLMRLPPSIDAPARATMYQIEQEERGMTTFVTSFERLARVEAKYEMVLRQLKLKFGPFSEALEVQIATLDTPQLDALSEALLSFTAQGHLEAWLQGQREGWDVPSFDPSVYAQAERNMVLRLLKRKFGELNEALEAQISALPPSLLAPLSEALLDFMTQAELDAWLREQVGG